MTEADKLEEQMSPEELQLAKDKLIQEMEIVDKQLDLSREKMRAEEKRHQEDMALKRQINDASIDNNGNVKLILSPFKDYGIIEILLINEIIINNEKVNTINIFNIPNYRMQNY